ncbi:MAG: type II secretion system protein [Phycisphaerae bacterium]
MRSTVNHKSKIQNRKSIHGFTLVELLVVVAIIAVLISILLPALTQARKTARMVVCQSHLKQLGTLLYYYSEDQNDFLPPGRGSYSNEPPMDWWYDALRKKYTEVNQSGATGPGTVNDIFFCSERSAEVVRSFSSSYPTISSYTYSSCGYRKKRNQGQNPDEIRVLMNCSWCDSGWFNTYVSLYNAPWHGYAGGPGPGPWDNWYYFLSKDHNQGANFLFYAGNVRYVPDRKKGLFYRDDYSTSDLKWLENPL